jgi:hypothetical protein
MAEAKYLFFKSKMLDKISQQAFLFQGLSIEMLFSMCF